MNVMICAQWHFQGIGSWTGTRGATSRGAKVYFQPNGYTQINAIDSNEVKLYSHDPECWPFSLVVQLIRKKFGLSILKWRKFDRCQGVVLRRYTPVCAWTKMYFGFGHVRLMYLPRHPSNISSVNKYATMPIWANYTYIESPWTDFNVCYHFSLPQLIFQRKHGDRIFDVMPC